MPNTQTDIQIAEYFLKPGYLIVNQEETLVRAVLGNCVAVTLFDRNKGFGGINHFVFPATRDRSKATAQYGNVAVTALYKMLTSLGAKSHSMEAQILGGAVNHSVQDENLGRENIEMARRMLKKFGVRVVSEDTGGYLGRKVIYHTGTNEIVIIKGQTIRREDWFLPGEDLRFRKTSDRF